MTEAINTIDSADYMKLFMQELTYQDPMKPVDNKEFMAQMAQFSALQQAQISNESLKNLIDMTTSNQAVMLLGRQVKITGSDEFGTVKGVSFQAEKPPQLNILVNGGNVSQNLNDITEIQ